MRWEEAEVTVQTGEAFYLQGGHLADALEDSELIEFTAAEEYRRKAKHLAGRLEI